MGDFGIKYVREEHAKHLIGVLEENYTIWTNNAETLGDPYIRGFPLTRMSLSRELKPNDGQTVVPVQPIAERTPRARLTRLLNGHTKIM